MKMNRSVRKITFDELDEDFAKTYPATKPDKMLCGFIGQKCFHDCLAISTKFEGNLSTGSHRILSPKLPCRL
jgi:hypothetical protein